MGGSQTRRHRRGVSVVSRFERASSVHFNRKANQLLSTPPPRRPYTAKEAMGKQICIAKTGKDVCWPCILNSESIRGRVLYTRGEGAGGGGRSRATSARRWRPGLSPAAKKRQLLPSGGTICLSAKWKQEGMEEETACTPSAACFPSVACVFTQGTVSLSVAASPEYYRKPPYSCATFRSPRRHVNH